MLLTSIMNTCYNRVMLLKCLHVYVIFLSFRVYVQFTLEVFDEMFELVFHWLFIFLWCRFETMTYLFSTQVRFNGGNPQLFKVQYINVTLKGLKDQLKEIDQRLNPRNTRRVEYVWYERPTLNEGRISFSRQELMNEDDTASMFSFFWQHNMFSWIVMYVTLLRSP